MSSVSETSIPEKAQINQWHELAKISSRKSGCSALTASLLILPALIIIFGAALCLTLPGVNALTQVILPAIVPSLIAIILSIPLIIYTVKRNRTSVEMREKIMTTYLEMIDTYNIAKREPEDATKFIKDNFLNEEWHKQYQIKLLTELQKKYQKAHPTKKDQDGKAIEDPVVEAITSVIKSFNPRNKPVKNTVQ